MSSPELQQVISQYSLKMFKVQSLSEKGKKSVWRLQTDRGRLILKKLPGTVQRAHFLAGALEHLLKAGVNVPAPVRTQSGGSLAVVQDTAYLLIQELSGRMPSYSNPSDLTAIMQGLADFHRGAVGFQPPVGSSVRAHLGKWERGYTKGIERLISYRLEAQSSRKNSFETMVSAETEPFIQVAEDCLSQLQREQAYRDWVDSCREVGCLCHQDYAKGNLLLDRNGSIHVFDLDSVTMDLPARDLRKITNKVMKVNPNGWDAGQLSAMLRAYQQVNPLRPEQWDVVFVDLRFPHLLIGLIDKYYRRRDPDWKPRQFLARLKRLIEVERSKENVIREVERTWRKI